MEVSQLFAACEGILTQLENAVREIREEDFKRPSIALSNATVSQHLRHTLEFFLCLEKGFSAGVVNYDKRDHDQFIEQNKIIALETLQRIKKFVASSPADKSLVLEVAYERTSEDCLRIETNYFRELIYNIEHSVHHMAIMKIGLREVAPYLSIPPDFGIAVSTLRYQETAVGAH
jgi:hypothetical protein